MTELQQIETMTLTEYIDKEMTKLKREAITLLELPTEQAIAHIKETMGKTARLIALQEIAYRIEYGFITEMGDTSLKIHLTKPY